MVFFPGTAQFLLTITVNASSRQSEGDKENHRLGDIVLMYDQILRVDIETNVGQSAATIRTVISSL